MTGRKNRRVKKPTLSSAKVVEPAPRKAIPAEKVVDHSLQLAAIGNCNIAALIDRAARICWCCYPRLDADAIFCGLLDASDAYAGNFTIEIENLATTRQSYERNTGIVSTILTDASGNAIEIKDFAPHFEHYDRVVRPPTLVRRLFPLKGAPKLRIVIRPGSMKGETTFTRHTGSHHIAFFNGETAFRVTTDAALSYIVEEVPFVLDRPINLILGPDEYLEAAVGDTARELYEKTRDFWHDWVRGLSIPFEWQDVVIRAAIALKLCSFEETGAIVAALTTSIPEAPDTERNWDYRFCWLRDAYFVVKALNQLGATAMMERFIEYVTNVAALAEGRDLKPVYAVVPAHPIEEHISETLGGYRNIGPVRFGNAAGEQVQNDVYGCVILAAAQMFFDERLAHPGSKALFEQLETLGEAARRKAFEPDASLWEFRGRAEVHTYTVAMCWAGCDRLAAIAERLSDHERARYWENAAEEIRSRIMTEGWSDALGSFVDVLGGSHLDASLLLLADIGFVTAADPKFVGTVEAVGRTLLHGSHLMRYSRADDFGLPKTAFTVCTLWYIEALAEIGRGDEARAIFEELLSHRNHVGLLSEDIDPVSGELWGNFPQSYSMVGLVNAAARLSKPWNNAPRAATSQRDLSDEEATPSEAAQ